MNISNFFKEKLSIVILCAGEGTRLEEITKFIPKPLIQIDKWNNISILHHIIKNLLELELYRIGVVIGHLGKSIRQFISTLEINNKMIKDKIKIIDSEEQYRLGPLYSLLSIIKDKNFFTSSNHYLILPGDTIFDYSLLKEVLLKIFDNFNYIQNHPTVFYRKIRSKPLKKLLGKERTISIAETTKLDSTTLLKKITQIRLKEFPSYKDLKQIIPVTLLSYESINEILKLNKNNLYRTVWEILNYMIYKGTEVFAYKIETKHNFYDIDYLHDIVKIKKKKRKGQ